MFKFAVLSYDLSVREKTGRLGRISRLGKSVEKAFSALKYGSYTCKVIRRFVDEQLGTQYQRFYVKRACMRELYYQQSFIFMLKTERELKESLFELKKRFDRLRKLLKKPRPLPQPRQKKIHKKSHKIEI